MFLTCVCYLVPVNSSYNVNANDFFDNLLFQVFQYQDIADFIYVAISMLAVVIWLTISKA